MKKKFDTFAIGARLAEMRGKKRVSPETLVHDLEAQTGEHITADYYKRLEAGTRFPSTPVLAALSEYFESTIDYLLYGDKGTDNSINNPEDAIRTLYSMITSLDLMSSMLRDVVTALKDK